MQNLRLSLFIFSLVFSLLSFAESLTSPVVDQAGILTPQERQQIVMSLEQLRTAKDVWMVILTVPSLNGSTVEQVAVDNFKRYEIGQKGKDNGLLLLLAPTEHKMRLEVGYGLEGALPDIRAKQLLDDVLQPYLKQNQFTMGILEVTRKIKEMNLEVQASPANQSVHSKSNPQESLLYLIVMVVIFWLANVPLYLIEKSRTENFDNFAFPRLSEHIQERAALSSYVTRWQSMIVLKTVALILIVLFTAISCWNTVSWITFIILLATTVIARRMATRTMNQYLLKHRFFLSNKNPNFYAAYLAWSSTLENEFLSDNVAISDFSTGGSFSSGGDSSSDSFSGGGSSGGGGASSDW